MIKKNIAILSGDGIGPEVINQALKVLNIIQKKFNHIFNYKYCLIGATAIDQTGNVLPKETIDICLKSDAILLGAVGDPKYNNYLKHKNRPEYGLLQLRKLMQVYCNIRPIIAYNKILNNSPLKNHIIQNTNFIIYRELTGGIYFGDKEQTDNKAYDKCVYYKFEIERIAIKAFEAALKRNKKICLIDKSNVLSTSKLWRSVIQEISKNYPNIKLDFMYIDNAAMQILINPQQFDIILTENMFGDIISDEASVITGSIGLIPSSSIGNKYAIFEPIHGSYPEAKGKNIANPIGCILSAAMMLNYLGLEKECNKIFEAVNYSINNRYYTLDINKNLYKTTEQVGDFISEYILNNN